MPPQGYGPPPPAHYHQQPQQTVVVPGGFHPDARVGAGASIPVSGHYHQISNISRTKYQNLNVSRLV